MADYKIQTEVVERALLSLEQGLEEALLTDRLLLRDGVIQRFEYTFELIWKLLQRALQQSGFLDEASMMSKKDLFRLAAQKNLISDEVFLQVKQFPAQARALLNTLRSHGLVS